MLMKWLTEHKIELKKDEEFNILVKQANSV